MVVQPEAEGVHWVAVQPEAVEVAVRWGVVQPEAVGAHWVVVQSEAVEVADSEAAVLPEAAEVVHLEAEARLAEGAAVGCQS